MNFIISEQEDLGLFSDTSKKEHLNRITRLREEMDRCDVDGMFLTQETNVRYATGMMDVCLLYTSPSPRDVEESRMPSSA